MANYADVDIYIKGEKEDLEVLLKAIKDVNDKSFEKILSKHDINVANSASSLEYCDYFNKELLLSFSSAWDETNVLEGFVKLIEKLNLKNLKITFYSVEEGCDVFTTNNPLIDYYVVGEKADLEGFLSKEDAYTSALKTAAKHKKRLPQKNEDLIKYSKENFEYEDFTIYKTKFCPLEEY